MPTISRPPGSRDEIFLVDHRRYLAPYRESDPTTECLNELTLTTVIAVSNDSPSLVTLEYLQSTIEHYKSYDDVFNEAFLAKIVLTGAVEGPIHIAPDAREYLSSCGNEWITFTAAGNLAPGPYILVDGRLRDAWLLEDDTSGTLMTSLRPQDSAGDTFETFHIGSTDNHFISIPLRSRLKAQHSSRWPIAGWRIVVKDNIDLSGVKTSLGNRAYYNLYPPRSTTAESLQRVLDRGIVIVGKTKMNSFGSWEEPLEYVDYQAPWNPRADGYQSIGGSSSGSAAAVSSYDWLDIAIGTDTTLPSLSRPIHHVMGIPFTKKKYAQPIPLVTIGLYWYHLSPARRKADFPSWSPVGWEGTVEFRRHDQPSIPSECDIKICTSDNSIHELLTDMDTLPTTVLHLQVRALVVKLPLVNIPGLTEGEENLYIAFPWSKASGFNRAFHICVLPYWEQKDLPSKSERDSIICVMLSGDPRHKDRRHSASY